MKFKIILISIFSLSAIFAQCDEAGGNSTWIGDGWCDTSNNNEACGWDNGDCCPNDCIGNVDNGCPDAGGCFAGDGVYDYCGDCSSCMDPGSADYEDCDDTGGTTGGGTTGGGDCEDLGDGSGGIWYDSDGPDYDCAWYESFGCPDYGDTYSNFGYNAQEACCACGGGSTGGGGTDGGTGGGDPTGAPTNLSASGDFGSITVSWSAPSGGGTGGTGGDPEGVGEPCTDADGYPGIADCALNCVDEATATSWIGDGFCDGIDQQWGMNLDCEYFNYDGGDCDDGTGGTTGGTTGGGTDGSCVDNCGNYYAGWLCQCDDACIDFGDCCPDYYDECAGGTTGGGTTGGTTGGGECPTGEIADCSGQCVDEATATSWIGDGFCDDGEWGMYLNCEEFNFDGGDCDGSTTGGGDTGGDTGGDVSVGDSCEQFGYPGMVIECSGQYCIDEIEIGDGNCTDFTNAGYPGVGFNCEYFNFDGGDCEGVDPNECPAGYVDNCNPDFEGASACCAEAWIGDGYCDGTDQAYGCDLLCYEGEDADCTDGAPEIGTTPSRTTFERENGLYSITTKEYYHARTYVREVKEYYSSENVKRTWDEYTRMVVESRRPVQNNNRELLGYNLYRDGALLMSDMDVSTMMYMDYDVMANTEYCYQVSAIYTEGESELTNSVCATSLGDPDATLSFMGSAASGMLDVHMSSSVDVAGFQFMVTGATVTNASGGLAEDAGFQIQSSPDGIVLGFSFDGSTIPAGDGTLVSIEFDYEGVVDICMETVVLSDSDGNPISVGVGGCESTEITVIMGDVNGDLSINVLDILVIVNSIVGGETLSPAEFEAADMNFDGSANVVDIIAIVNIILGDGSAMAEPINEGTVTVDAGNISVKSNGSIAGFELDVNGNFTLDNSQLPNGWNLYQGESKVLAFTTDGQNLSDEITIPFAGSINVTSGLITDLHSSVVYAETTVIPDSYIVSAAYPNPFNPVTQFEYAIPEDVNVNITVYDASGAKVADIQDSFQTAGNYSVSWDAGNQPSGIYFVRFVAGEFTTSEKVMLLK